MKKNIQVEGHKFSLEFINDNFLHKIKIRNLLTNATFEGKDIELMRVKRDTIYAALERRQPKSITYKIEQISEGEKKWLKLHIQVNLDFLPSFSEALDLQEVFEFLGNEDFMYEVEELEEMINLFEENKNDFHQEIGGKNVSQNQQLWEKKLKRGKYYLQLSGMCQGQNKQNQDLMFTLKVNEKEEAKLRFKTGTRSNYLYPYNLSYFVELDHDATISVSAMSTTSNMNTSLQSHHTTCIPAVSVY